MKETLSFQGVSLQENSMLKARFLAHVIPLAGEIGWTEGALERAAEGLGYPSVVAWALFPGGVEEALSCWSRQVDAQLRQALTLYSFETLKVRERIFWGVRTRFEILASQKASVSQAAGFFMNPLHTCRGTQLLQETVHTIWVAAGDTSTDWNYYSKRCLLSGIYVATSVHWLKDISPDHESTWAFLKKRIDDVMKLQSLKGEIKGKILQAKVFLNSLIETFLPPKK